MLAVVISVSILIGLLLKNVYKGEWVEFAAFVTGVVGVYLVAVEHIINWPVGLVNVSIYAWVFYKGGLPADMTLQFFYFAVGIQGWYFWAHGGDQKASLKISRIPPMWWAYIAGIIGVGTAIYVPIIRHYQGASPFVDSILTVTSIVAQLLINAKKIENWILWIIVDVAYIPLYVSRHLYSTAYLYAIFLLLAVFGLVGWIKAYRAETSIAGA